MTAAVQQRHVDERVLQMSVGGLAAQAAKQSVRAGDSADRAWLAFCELASTHGWKSAACRAFVRELAKPASGQ